MAFVVVTKSLRFEKEPQVFISSNTRHVLFNSSFIKRFGLVDSRYIRLAYDADAKVIAFDFLNDAPQSSEAFRLNKANSSVSRNISINSLINSFNMDISAISGYYIGDAIGGPVAIEGFSEHALLLYVEKRVPDQKAASKAQN